MDFSSISIAFLIHATEAADELLKKVTEVFAIADEEISVEKMEGYYGNDILSVKIHLIGPRTSLVSNRIFSRLSKNSREVLRAELDRSMDEHDSLYIRVDRQTLGSGDIFLSDEEPIHMKLKPKWRTGGHEFMKRQYAELIK